MNTKNFIMVGIIFLLIPISYAYSQNETNSQPSEKPEETLLKDVPEWIPSIIMTFVGIITGVWVKIIYDKRNLSHEKQLEHRRWSLQQFNRMAESYYFPMAKFAHNAHDSIRNASVSQDQYSIRIAFQNTCVFLAKYIEFKNEKGANFLFHNTDNTNIVIKKIQAILNGFPFDLLMLNQIAFEIGKKNHKFVIEYKNPEFYGYFEKWITNECCNKSRRLVIEKLLNLASTLDDSSEKIAQGKYLQQSSHTTDLQKYATKKQNDPFYIISTNKKSIQKEESLFVFGKGFNNKKITYDFYIGDKKMDVECYTDEHVKLKIPSDMEDGTCDVFAKFKNQEGVEDETIGLAVHINSKSSQ